jgi:hypothetical protein
VNEDTQAGTTAEAPPKRAPKTFLQTMQEHLYGYTADELTAALQTCISESERTGKATELKLTLRIKPESKAQGRYSVLADVSTKLPAKEREAAIMFVGPEGNLQTKDPRQQEIPGLRVAEGPSAGKRLEEEQQQPGRRIG